MTMFNVTVAFSQAHQAYIVTKSDIQGLDCNARNLETALHQLHQGALTIFRDSSKHATDTRVTITPRGEKTAAILIHTPACEKPHYRRLTWPR